MSNRSNTEAFNFLTEALREHNMGWVVSQVQEQIRSGKPLSRQVKPHVEELPSFSGQSMRKETLATTEEYTSAERLHLLVKGIQIALIQPADIEDALVDYFGSQEDYETSIKFMPDEFDNSEQFTLVRNTQERSAELSKLKTKLSKIAPQGGNNGDS